MKSFTTLRNLYGSFTQNTASDNLTLGDQLINDENRRLLRKVPWLLEATATDVTVASQQFYSLPFNYGKLIDVTTTVGSFLRTPKESPSRNHWDRLNINTSIKNDYPEWYYIYNRQIGFWPTPSSSSKTITMNYQKRVKDLSVADYVTGTVSVTNASTTVTGSGTTFTKKMVGRWIRVTDGDTTATTGDGEWYEIGGYTSTTVITLSKAYAGETASGAAFTIGQMSPLPEDYEDIPVYFAASVYWQTRDEQRYTTFLTNYVKKLKDFTRDYGEKTQSIVLDNGIRQQMPINPNLLITL